MAILEATSSVRLRELQTLAGRRAAKGVVVSLYFRFDPAFTPTGVEVSTRLASLVSRATRTAAVEGLGHAARRSFELDLQRAAEHVRRALGPGGVACFVDTADELWQSFELREPVPDELRVAPFPYLVPLVAAGRDAQTLVAVVGRERGHVYELRAGRLELVVDLSEEQPRRHRDAEAWQQSRLERHVDELGRAHLSRVATELDRLVRQRRAARLVLAGEQEHTSALVAMLSAEGRAATAGVVHPESHAGAAELEPLVLTVVERDAQREEASLVEQWRAAAGRREGAVEGWADTLAAASEGRVALLLFRVGATHAAFQCPACGRSRATAGSCPVDGRPLEEQPDGLDLAVRLTLAHGGDARAVRETGDFDPTGGVGALLAY